MKQRKFELKINESSLKFEPTEKVEAFAKRLNKLMAPIRRDISKKLKLSALRAKNIIVK